MSSNKDRLSAAAEELLRALDMDVSASANEMFDRKLNKLTQVLESTNQNLDAKINKLTQVLESNNQNLDAKINKLTQVLESTNQNIDTKISTMNQKLVAQDKMRRLEWALQNIDLVENFHYNADGTYYFAHQLIAGCLISFRQNRGYYLPVNADYYQETDACKKKQFKKEIVQQIYNLVGVEPRIEWNSEQKKDIIYYS